MKELIVLWAVPAFFGLMLLELAVCRARTGSGFRLDDALTSLSIGMVSQVSGAFAGAIGLATYGWAGEHLAPFRLPAHAWWTWALAFVGFDLAFYWSHRLSHRVNLFWASHVVHHSSEEYNLTTALRQPATSFLFTWMIYLPLGAAGIPTEVFAVAAGMNLVYQFWPHTRLVGRLGWLEGWLVTPSNHRVHHARNPFAIDRNFGGVFAIWDRIFGTYAEERDDEPLSYGIRDPAASFDPFVLNLHHYGRICRDLLAARTWAERVRVVLGPPEWHPPGRACLPRPARRRLDPRIPAPLSAYCLAQSVLALAATVHFMAVQARVDGAPALLEAAAVVAGTVTVGGLLAGRREFLILEALRLAATALGLAALWAHGSFAPAEPAYLAALLAPVAASAVALTAVAGETATTTG